jgi:hypothetical protein
MIAHSVIQGSEEWHQLRLGKLTGSQAHILLLKDNSKTKETYINSKVAEIATGRRSDTDIWANSRHMERGKQLESTIVFLYEIKKSVTVEHAGFIEIDNLVGCSVDGLVGDTGLIEVKAPDTPGYVKVVAEDYIDSKYFAQMQFNLYVTKRKWCDYVCYNQYFPNPLHILRIERDEDFIQWLAKEIKKAKELIAIKLTKLQAQG